MSRRKNTSFEYSASDIGYPDSSAREADLLRQDFRELRREIDNIRRRNELRMGKKELLNQELLAWERERAAHTYHRQPERFDSPPRRLSRSPRRSPRNSTELLLAQQRQLDREREVYLSSTERRSPRGSRSPSRLSPSRRDMASPGGYESSVYALKESADRLSHQREKFEKELEAIRKRQQYRSLNYSDGIKTKLLEPHK